MKLDDFPHKRIAKISATTLGFCDRDVFTAMIHVDYGGSAQGVGGYLLSGARCAKFITRVLKAVGVRSWEQLKGRTLFVLMDSPAFQATPIGLAPLPTEDGEVFLFKDLES
jgi:hypothetical protein